MNEPRTPRYVAESIVHDAARQFVEDDIANAIAGEFTRRIAAIECEAATPPLDVEALEWAMNEAATALRFTFGESRVPGMGVVAHAVAIYYDKRLAPSRGGAER